MGQPTLPYSHICQKVTILQGSGPFTLPGTLPYTCSEHLGEYDKHRWELPGNYPVLTVVMVIYHYVERIWRILITPIF